jgi:hypothetical protein
MKVHPIIQFTLHKQKYPSHCVLFWCSSMHANILRWGEHITNLDKILDEQKPQEAYFKDFLILRSVPWLICKERSSFSLTCMIEL